MTEYEKMLECIDYKINAYIEFCKYALLRVQNAPFLYKDELNAIQKSRKQALDNIDGVLDFAERLAIIDEDTNADEYNEKCFILSMTENRTAEKIYKIHTEYMQKSESEKNGGLYKNVILGK